jgi:4-diphosphocytidyl-2-C-methyl-D-erythritol kinase
MISAPEGETTLLAPAKINLFLHVMRRRPDGYHDLASLMCPLTLADRLQLRVGGTGHRLRCGHPDVPHDGSNLVLRAADVFGQAIGRTLHVAVHLEKRIPVAAGLGGGSSDAAAVLLGLNRLCGQPLTREDLIRLAAGIGADVPFFILGRTALARGIGERLSPFDGVPAQPVVLLCPPIAVSTAAVFGRLNLGLTKCEEKFNDFLLKGQFFDARQHLCNDLETVSMAMHPEIGEAKRALLRQGASGALMSGSGPSVFGMFSDGAAAGRAARTLARDGRWTVLLTAIEPAPID